jgi:carbon monoxide dehydrogenase subunit G
MMGLVNEFRVDVPVAEAWEALTDLPRVASCMPGAALDDVVGDEYRGTIKVKLGPISAQYKGVATFVEQDPAAYRAVVSAAGRDSRGQGNASARVTATLTPAGSGTEVAVVTELQVTGKVAQFGRGVMADVSRKLLGQFADALEADLTAGRGGAAGAGAIDSVNPEAPVAAVTTGDSLDLARLAGTALARRLVVPAVVLLLVVWQVGRRRR